MTIQALALDPGFGNFKIGCRNGDSHTHIATIPSVIGIGQTDLGLLNTGLNGHKKQVKPFSVQFDQINYLVGPNVHRFGQPIERLDFQRLFSGPEVRALTYVALASILDTAAPSPAAGEGRGGGLGLAILVGLPVEILQDRQRGLATLAGLKEWLVGSHKFCVNGKPYSLAITAIKAMAQPLGSYFAWGLNNDGEWSRPAADFNAPVAVADIGFNTLDLFGIERGQVISRLTSGKALGMHRAATTIRRLVSLNCRADLSLSQADELIREHLKGQLAEVHTPAASIQVNHLVQQALDETFAGINEFLREHWSGGGFRYLILTGGGAEALKKPLLNQYPQAVYLPDPVTANVDGLARYARKVFKS